MEHTRVHFCQEDIQDICEAAIKIHQSSASKYGR